MGIVLPDLLIETTIRDGLAYLKKKPSVIDDIFGEMLKGYASRKYGQTEINRIKTLIASKNIAVVHSFAEAEAKSPCFSIQLGAESEAKERAHLSDHEYDIQEAITDSAALAALVKVSNLIPTAYDPISGKVSVSDSVDMTPVHPAYIYKDGDGNEFELKPGISNVPGNKFFFIDKFKTPNIGVAGLIKSFLDMTQHEAKGDVSAVNILIGCHSKEALLTKYLYVILKYIMKSRKRDLIQRGFTNSSFQGSDFTKDIKYEGDQIYTRFFTASGQVEDAWSSDDVELIDSIEIDGIPID
jgi:hypothetical protein